jgi:hypothetical protein
MFQINSASCRSWPRHGAPRQGRFASAEEVTAPGRGLSRMSEGAPWNQSSPATQKGRNQSGATMKIAAGVPGASGRRVDLDQAARDAHAVGRKLLPERRRRAAILQSVLIAVPGTCDAPVDDAPLPDRSVLVGAEIRQRADPGPVAKHRNALATGRRNDAGTLVWDRKRRSDRKPAVITQPVAGGHLHARASRQRGAVSSRREIPRPASPE